MTGAARKVVKRVIRLYRRWRPRGRRCRAHNKPVRVAYFVGGGIGDAVMTYPALERIRREIGRDRLDVFVPRDQLPLLRGLFEGLSVKPLQSVLATVGRPPGGRYDVALANTIAAFRVRIELAAFFCAHTSSGFRYPSEDELDRLFDRSRPVADGVHDTEQNLALACDALGIEVAPVDSLLPSRLSVSGGDRVVVHPGSRRGYENKRWPVERYASFVSRLAEAGASVTVLVGPAERALAAAFGTGSARIVRSWGPEVIAEVLRGASLFVGNDSGPAHVAAFLGVPTVVLNGPVDPARSAPRGRAVTVVWNRQTCAPCHFAATDCRDNRCMKSITVDQVCRAVNRVRPSFAWKGMV